MKILVTGGTGFFGGIVKLALAEAGHDYVNLDRLHDPQDQVAGRMELVDLRDTSAVDEVFQRRGPFDAVCHGGAVLAHEASNHQELWDTNMGGTRNVADSCRRHGVKKLIFTSTNCLWGKPLNRPVKESDPVNPVEIYGRSKLAAEQLLQDYRTEMDVVIFRSSTIIAPGRVGLLGILFDFIAEGRRIPIIGRGDKPYQFIDAGDYAAAILLALARPGSDTFHVGSHHACSLAESYAYVIEKAGSTSKIYRWPAFPALDLMRLCHALGVSPLGPYHYNMIAEEFIFDTSHVERTLGWHPTKTNGEILYAAYEYYVRHRKALGASGHFLPAHRRRSHPGVIQVLRWLS